MSVEVGHRLRQARESQGYTLEEMEQYTRISVQELASLEAGDFSLFSSPYYLRVYLRTYANALGLNSRELLNDYRLRTRRADDQNPGQQVAWYRSRMTNQRSASPLQGREFDQEEESLSRVSRYSRRQRVSSSEGRDGKDAVRVEEVEVVDMPGGEHRRTPRRVSMPPDLPEPEELGLPPKRKDTREQTQPPTLSRSSTLGPRPRGKRKAGRKAEKSGESSFGTWYNRFLILMALLLIPAAIYVYFKITGDDVEKAAGEPRQDVQSGKQEEPNPAPEETSQPLLVPVDPGEGEIDRYELTNADQIELKFKSKGECWFQIREQEVGGQLEDRVLKDGDTFSYPYKKGKELYLQLGRPSAVEVTVNGNKMKTPYEKGKVFHISLVK